MSGEIQEYEKGAYWITTDPEKQDIPFIQKWLAEESYWARAIPISVVRRMVANSLSFGLFHKSGESIGYGRVVTDYTTFAWITDVFVIQEFRGKGLSRFIMDSILEYPELGIIRRWLLGTDHAHGLYRKYDFTDLDHPENFLTRHISDMYGSGKYDDLINGFFKGAS